jgi:hypothetical protein
MKKAASGAAAVCLLSLMVVGNALGAREYSSMSVNPGGIVWQPLAITGGATLSITGPRGVAIRQAFDAGTSPELGATDAAGAPLPDGLYSYELAFAPASGLVTRRDGAAVAAPAGEPMIQSGSFRVVDGRFFVPGSAEEASGATAGTAADGRIALDVVVADDSIVTGSLCVGFDCVDGESFGFDTIKMKENNTRLRFEDTSVGTFPTNDWQIIANDSASGGANYLAIEDMTGLRVPFKVAAGAATNALVIDSAGRVGLRTATPVLDLQITTGNTPAVRFEQNNTGGYTSQTWDVAGNEANFFIRDVTGGSRLPFRIRPGAPTSSIDIMANGYVGIGTNVPTAPLTVSAAAGGNLLALTTSSAVAGAGFQLSVPTGGLWNFKATQDNGFKIRDHANSLDVMFLQNATGNVGIGTVAPAHRLEVCGTAGCSYNEGGTTWVDASSREYKENIRTLEAASAIDTLRGLNPVTYSYKGAPGQNHVGFIAEDVPDLVAMRGRKGLSSLDIVAVLTKVVQEQGRTIEELRDELAALRGAIDGSGR